MMAQNASTLALIEVGENTKARSFLNRAKNWSAQQLIDAIEICNHADINYKNSKNPRLTVEIALMQLASLTAAKVMIKKKVLNSSSTTSKKETEKPRGSFRKSTRNFTVNYKKQKNTLPKTIQENY